MTRLVSNAEVFSRIGNTWVSSHDQEEMRVTGHRVHRDALPPNEALRRLRMVHIVNRMRRAQDLPTMDTRPPTSLVPILDKGDPEQDQFTLARLAKPHHEPKSETKQNTPVTTQRKITNILLKMHASQRELGRTFIRVKEQGPDLPARLAKQREPERLAMSLCDDEGVSI